jgi:hypothetical protein
MGRFIKTGPQTRRRSPKPVPGKLPLVGTYKSQALPRSYLGLERALGSKLPIILDFFSRNDWTTVLAQPGNLRTAWQNQGRRIVFSFMTAIENFSSPGGSDPQFATAAGGASDFTACNTGLLNPIWDSIALQGQYDGLRDVLLRINWEMEGGYFPGTASGLVSLTEWRRSWRTTVARIKTGPNAQYAVAMDPWFNPTGNPGAVGGIDFWPGAIQMGGSAAPAANVGLPGDWFKNATTGDIYEKPYDGTPNSTWTLRPGATWPRVFVQPDDVALKDDGTPYLDFAGNSFCWVKYVGSEAYAQTYSIANDSPQSMWADETLGTGLGVTPVAGVNSRGLQYWADYAVLHQKMFCIGECGCGYKVDFPGGQSIEVYGHGGPGDNSYHYRKLYEFAVANNAQFMFIWDQPAGDFNCEWSRSARVAGVPTSGDFRGDKPLVSGACIELFGYPGTPIGPFDESNVPATAISLDYSAAVAAGKVTVTDPTHIIIKSALAGDIIAQASTSPAGAKRIVYASFFGGDGNGYGILTPGGKTGADRSDPTNYDKFRLRTPVRNSVNSSFYAQGMSEVGPFITSPRIFVTVQNQVGTYGPNDGSANLACAADQINLVAVTTPSPASSLVIPTSLQIKLGTGAVAGQKFRAVLYSKTGAATRGGSPLLISAEVSLTYGDITAGLKTIPWTATYALTPGTDYWVGVWGNSACGLGIASSGTGNTFRGTATYNSAADQSPVGSSTLTDTGSLGLYAVVSYEF